MSITNIIKINDSTFNNWKFYLFYCLIPSSNFYFPIMLLYILMIKMSVLKLLSNNIYQLKLNLIDILKN